MNRLVRHWKIALLALVVAAPVPAGAIGTITDGDVSFGYTTPNFATSFRNTVDTDFTGAAPGDLTWESWWFFRVEGDGAGIGPDGRESAFGNPNAEDYTLNGGSVGRLDWNDPGGAGLFSAILAFEVMDTGVDQGVLFQNMQITNTHANPLTISLFHYTDLDLATSFGGDSASVTTAGGDITIDVTDGVRFSPIRGYGADAYQVTGYSTLLRNLTDGNRDSLTNTGDGFGPGDYTGAFQWTMTLGVGERASFLTQFGSDAPLQDPSTSIVPEPGTAVLTGLGLLALARRREACA